MSLSNVSFTNSAGTLTLSRVTYTISHNYTWRGEGEGVETISVVANGWFKADADTSLNDVESKFGNAGTLTLPSGILSNMKVSSVSYEDGTWAPWGKVSVQFETETEDYSNDGAVTWWGYKLYSPRLTISPSIIKKSEEALHGISGWLRQQMGHNNFTMSLTGVLRLTSDEVPEAFLNTMEKKDTGGVVPSGYPLSFNLVDAIPEANGNLEIEECVVTRGTVEWHVEHRFANVTIDMVAPPQTIGT